MQGVGIRLWRLSDLQGFSALARDLPGAGIKNAAPPTSLQGVVLHTSSQPGHPASLLFIPTQTFLHYGVQRRQNGGRDRRVEAQGDGSLRATLLQQVCTVLHFAVTSPATAPATAFDSDCQHSYNHHGMQRENPQTDRVLSAWRRVLTRTDPKKASTRKCWYATSESRWATVLRNWAGR